MQSNHSVSALAAVARLYWMFLGPGLLFVLASKISQSGCHWLAPLSVSYLLALALVLVARQIDPLDSYGEPRAPGAVRGFTIGALALGVAAWLAAHWR